ncbi:hypothetical protein [Rhodococcus pyridinivorans]|nr:hypothetical protein [Rhodococcus pyridinivorans]
MDANHIAIVVLLIAWAIFTSLCLLQIWALRQVRKGKYVLEENE